MASTRYTVVCEYWDDHDGDCGRVSSSKNQEVYRCTVHLCSYVSAWTYHVYSGQTP